MDGRELNQNQELLNTKNNKTELLKTKRREIRKRPTRELDDILLEVSGNGALEEQTAAATQSGGSSTATSPVSPTEPKLSINFSGSSGAGGGCGSQDAIPKKIEHSGTASSKATATSKTRSSAKTKLSIKLSASRDNLARKESAAGAAAGGKKRERWLLTRKTWRYMTDAGRKLIPDGVQNRPEDIPKLEKHFSNLCSAESKFILWRRKASYPGAMGSSRYSSKRKLKHLLSRSHKSMSADESDDSSRQQQDQLITMLQGILNIDVNAKTTTLLGTKTVRPDQTQSPSAKRPPPPQSSSVVSSKPSISPALQSQAQRAADSAAKINELLEKLRQYSQQCGASKLCISPDRITPDILQNKALLRQIYSDLKRQQLHRILGKHTSPARPLFNLPHASSLSSLWYSRRNDAKEPRSCDLTTGDDSIGSGAAAADTSPSTTNSDQESFAATAAALDRKSLALPVISIKKPQAKICTHSGGTQTNFIHLHELQRLAKEYELRKKEAAMAATSPTDDESDKGGGGDKSRRKSSIDNEDVSQSVSDTIKRYLRMARKKSVHDDGNRFKRVNYDRNLKNIRAKGEISPPGMDDGNSKQTQTLDAWPRLAIEYIRGCENSQLLDEAHLEWQKSLEQLLRTKEEFDRKMAEKLEKEQLLKNNNYSADGAGGGGGQTSPPPPLNRHHSSSSLFQSGQQFLSNLWHGAGSSDHNYSSHQPSPTNSIISISSAMSAAGAQFGGESTPQKPKSGSGGGGGKILDAMQKSKSSSNVGQFVSKKIWRSRSKSQTRTTTTIPLAAYSKPDWTPQGNCVWTSSTGKRLILIDSKLNGLTEIERKLLHRVAIDKINQLNIGVSLTAPIENGSSGRAASKPQKRRPLLIKRKALTTSFFDSIKNSKEVKAATSGLMFGIPLEKCVENDQRLHKDAGGGGGGGGSGGEAGDEENLSNNRGSINSIIGVHDHGGPIKGEIGSCESLPAVAKTKKLFHKNSDDQQQLRRQQQQRSSTGVLQSASGSAITGVNNLITAAAAKISRSQTDMRRQSQDNDDLLVVDAAADGYCCVADDPAPPMTALNHRICGQKIPAVVTACISHIEEHGLYTVGIFRVSTSKKRVRQLKEEFDRGNITTLDSETCPHDVATILKEYLRELPEPLLCTSLYKGFVKTQKIRNRRLQLEALSHLVQLLPVVHRDTLFALLKFLAKIVRASEDVTSSDGTVLSHGNKMDSSNLATVFAPNILRLPCTTGSQNSYEQELDEQMDIINVFRTMIDHYEELFRVPAEIMDEIYTNMMDSYPQQLDYLCERRDNSYNDEMDSASSSTPLSSPPPIFNAQQSGGNRNLIDFQQMFSEYSGGNPSDIFPSSSKSISSNRKVYSREDFMHENAATGNPNASDKRTERSPSKLKSTEMDADRRRRRDRSASAGGGGQLQQTSSKNYHSSGQFVDCDRSVGSASKLLQTSSLEQQQQQQQQYYNQSNQSARKSSVDHHHHQQQQQQQQRKFSSPFVLNNTGVLSASLKIPVQIQQQQQLQQQQDDRVNNNKDDHLDLTDIPYIEDNNSYDPDWSEAGQHPITGSLSLTGIPNSRKPAGATAAVHITATNSQNVSFQQQKQQQQQQSSRSKSSNNNNNNNNNNKLINTASSAMNYSDFNLLPPSSLSQEIQSDRPKHREPKLTPSITNIGGAVLRSKTADFERMLTQNKKHKSSDIPVQQQQQQQQNASSSTTSVDYQPGPPQPPPRSSSQSVIIENKAKSKQQQQHQGPIYKRQELISSAKRTNK